MSKLARFWVFLAVMGSMAACGASPVDLADNCDEGIPDPNSFCGG